MGNQASSSSSITNNWTHDVFVSYYAKDTHLGFVNHLYQSLRQRKFDAFFFDDIMDKPNKTSLFFRAIRQSRIGVIIFSKNYVSSACCLEELTRILEYFQEGGRLIYLVLYDVDLPDLRHLRGSYAEALARVEERFKDYGERVKNWRKALSKAAGLRQIRLKPNYGGKTLLSIINYFCESLHRNRIQGFQEDLTTSVQWVKVESIGAGGFGIVYLGFDMYVIYIYIYIIELRSVTGEVCAIKEILHIENLQNASSLNQEVQILSRLEHQNIVKYYDSKIVNSQISLYMEYIESGSLKKYIRARRALEESLVRRFTAQIVSGLVYLHSQSVVHRDIKPDNILVNSNDIAKLADFGLAKHLAQSVGNHSKLGTVYYAAPEVIRQEKYNSPGEACAADIWSLGCVVIEMFTGMNPWPKCTNPAQVMFKVGRDENPENPEIPENLSTEGKDFLEHCFIRAPANRPSAAALLNHAFVTTQTYNH